MWNFLPGPAPLLPPPARPRTPLPAALAAAAPAPTRACPAPHGGRRVPGGRAGAAPGSPRAAAAAATLAAARSRGAPGLEPARPQRVPHARVGAGPVRGVGVKRAGGRGAPFRSGPSRTSLNWSREPLGPASRLGLGSRPSLGPEAASEGRLDQKSPEGITECCGEPRGVRCGAQNIREEEERATPEAKQRHSEGGKSVCIGFRSQWLETGVGVRRAKVQPLGELGTGAVETWKDRFVLV